MQNKALVTGRLNSLLFVWSIAATFACLMLYFNSSSDCPYTWHGGSPKFNHGSCWCGGDGYCMCTPSLAIDAIIEIGAGDDLRVVLVQRKDPPRDIFAIPGGFVDVGESVESAVMREVREETGLVLTENNLHQFRVYSDPARDKRRHTVSSVFRCVADESQIKHLKRGDDAKSVVLIPIRNLLQLDLAFDHNKILREYLQTYHSEIIN